MCSSNLQGDRSFCEGTLRFYPSLQQIDVVQLCKFMFTQLMQAVVDWPYSFNHSVGALPMWQELGVSTEKEQEHVISRFETPWV